MKRATQRGITEQQIREAIEQILAEDQEPTTTAVRAILGSGSFSTIASVLSKWRDEKASDAKTPMPQIPKSATQLTQRLWSEAWQSALEFHETERDGFRAQRRDWNREKSELEAEVSQLESLCAEQLATLEEHAATLNEKTRILVSSKQDLAVANARIESLETEIGRLLDERRQFSTQLAEVSERAAMAETRLQQATAQPSGA